MDINTQRIELFNNLFFEFMNDLVILFPNDNTINFCKNGAYAAILLDKGFVAKEFKKTVLQFEDHILKKNESYFLHETFKENFNSDNFIMNEINRVINIWKDPNTSSSIKKKIWDYMIKLVKVCKAIKQ